MARRLGIVSLLVAWICANGLMLDMVQCFAWAKMFVGYVPQMSIVAAVVETFDAAKPCALCASVAKAREHEEPAKSVVTKTVEKVVCVLQAAAPVTFAAVRPAWPRSEDACAPTRADRVPLPPPRAGQILVLA